MKSVWRPIYFYPYCCHSQTYKDTRRFAFPLAAQARVNDPNDVLSRTFKAIRKDGFFLSAAGQRL